MTNAASRRQIDATRKRQLTLVQTNATIITTLMSTPDGRAWVWDQLRTAKVFHEDRNLDPHEMAYAKGLRWTALQLWSTVLAKTPTMVTRMIEENANPKEADDGRDDSSTDDA